MPYKKYNVDVTPKAEFSLSFYQPKKNAAAITAPIALTASDIVELADNTDNIGSEGRPISYGIGETWNFSQVDLGLNQKGEIASSLPSPVFAYSTLAAGAGFGVNLNFAEGVIGKLIIIQSPVDPDARAAAWFLRGVTQAVIFDQVSPVALTLAKFTDLGQTLYEAQEEIFKTNINGASRELRNRLNDRELQNAGQIREVTSSTLAFSGEIPNSSEALKQLIGAGGDLAKNSAGQVVGGSGYKQGVCLPDRWMVLKEAGGACASAALTGFAGTFAQDTTTQATDTGNLNFEVTEQSRAFMKGIRPLSFYETAA